MNVDQLEDHLRAKYKGKLEEHANGAPMLDLMDKTEYGAFELKLIQVKKDQRGRGVGGQVMNDLLKYADDNNYIIVLSPSEIKTAKLIKWYKSFDFMENKNRNKDFRFMSRMIRYPHGMTRSKWIDANPATAWLDPVSKYNLIEYGANEFSQEQLDAFGKKPTTESRQRSGNKLNLKQCLEIRENQYRSRDGQHDYQPEEIDERILELTGNKDEREMKRMEKLADEWPEDVPWPAAASTINWKLPEWKDESEEFVRYTDSIDKEDFDKAVEKGLTDLTVPMWKKLANTDSFGVKSREQAIKIADAYGKNIKKIFDGLANGEAMPAPIIWKKENGDLELVGGNTRLMALRVLILEHKILELPKVLIVGDSTTAASYSPEVLEKVRLERFNKIPKEKFYSLIDSLIMPHEMEGFVDGLAESYLGDVQDSYRYLMGNYPAAFDTKRNKEKVFASAGHELKFKLSTIPGQRKAMEEKLEKLADQGKIEIGRVYKTNEPGESILIAHILWAEEKAYQEIMKYLNLYKQMGDKYEMEFDKKIEQKAAAMSKFDKALQKVQQDYETGVYTGYLDPKKYEKELREELASISGKPIYRAVKLDHENQLDPKSIGIYWTWDKDKAVTYWGHEGTMTVTLESEASDDIVDWEATIEQWIKPQYNGECEVRLKPKAHVEVTNVWVNKIKKDKKFKAVALVNEDTTIKDATYSLSSRCDCEISIEDLRDLIAQSKTKEFQPEQMKSIYRAHGETFFDHGDRTPVTLDEALDILYETDCPCVALKDGKYYALDGQHRINTAILCGSPLDIRVVDVKGLDFITHGYRLPEIKATIPSAAMYPLSNQTNEPTVDHRVVGSYTWEQVWESWKKNHTGEVSENTPELKARIEKFASFEKQSIPLDKIKFVYDSPFDPYKPLKPSEDEEWAVENYAKLKTEAPPVIAYEGNGVYHLIDGRHRTRAAAFRGDKTITAFVANKDHL
jgi:hypothetical protein